MYVKPLTGDIITRFDFVQVDGTMYQPAIPSVSSKYLPLVKNIFSLTGVPGSYFLVFYQSEALVNGLTF